jgi:hypothetical protein
MFFVLLHCHADRFFRLLRFVSANGFDGDEGKKRNKIEEKNEEKINQKLNLEWSWELI